MSVKNFPKGYVINQYQYAKRYRYNNKEFLQYFNYKIEKYNESQIESSNNKYMNTNDYLTFGEFDLIEIFAVDSFRKYHDVSNIAKSWVGKRQSVLLYDISDDDKPINMYFDRDKSAWKFCNCNNNKDETIIEKNFFCLSMFSLTNEISEAVNDLSDLLKKIRKKILNIVDVVNQNVSEDTIKCEVFGTFNTSEVAVVWLSDQYVDILRVLDSIKHINMTDKKCIKHPVFLTSYSTIGIEKKKTIKFDSNDVRGNALIQVAIHDAVENYEQLKEVAKKITKFDDKQIGEHLRHSVGEYDLLIELPASEAVSLICREGYLHVAPRKDTEQKDYSFYEQSLQKVLKSNIKLFYNQDDVKRINDILESENYSIDYEGEFTEFQHNFEYNELMNDTPSCEEYNRTNEYFYLQVRNELKNKVRASAGAVDTLDLLYTDYKSVISSAYNAIWVSDFHRQFKSVLRAIHMIIIDSDDTGWSWDLYLDLTNSFKQQIYHLSQSSRMFFETPRCHLRSTGQYDYLMHAYYGITKQIIEAIYLMQDTDSQSELVPLITVNNVPQVKSQLYFEVGKLYEMRTINLDIPNSIIFDFRRGTEYLTHELFHYAVPNKRVERNYCIGLLVITLILKRQVLNAIINILKTGMDLPYNPVYNEIIDKFFVADSSNSLPNFTRQYIFDDIDEIILTLVKENYDEKIYRHIQDNDYQLFSVYNSKIFEFCLNEQSNSIFDCVFKSVFSNLYKKFMNCSQIYESCCEKLNKKQSLSDTETDIYEALHDCHDILKSRLEYCNKNTNTFNSYIEQFNKEKLSNRYFSTSRFKKLYEKEFVDQILQSVREAGPDIAMASLNGMSVDDYMLFCIQSWQDTNLITSNYNILSPVYDNVVFRVSLVMDYFISQKRKDWDLNTKVNNKFFLNKNTENDFVKKYIWFYTKQSTRSSDASTRKKSYDILVKEAENWINFFKYCYKDYSINYAVFYKDVFFNILKDFDIERKISLYKNDENKKEVYERILNIRENFASRVTDRYNKLFDTLPDELYNVEENSIENINYLSGVFKQNLSVANLFQKQKTLKELFEINNKLHNSRQETQDKLSHCISDDSVINSESCSYEKKRFWEINIRSLNELLFYMKYCIEDFSETAQTLNIINARSVWFRGQTSGNYSLIPTIARNFSNAKLEKYKNIRRNQQSEFEEFKFRADGASEMVVGKDYTKSDYIALMQHYHVSTNFLDWSENAFPALYFALRYYFDFDKAQRDKKGKNRDVVLFLFHPGIYNSIRTNKLNELRKNIDKSTELTTEKNTDKYALFDKNIFDKLLFSNDDLYANLIPNLSMKNNEALYNMFLLGDIEYDKYFSEQGEALSSGIANNPEWKDLFMPLSVWTSRLNSRIRAQSGCFVAFNLYAPPEITEKNGKKVTNFEYTSLEEIQKRNLKNSMNEKDIFLYKLILDKDCCDDIVKWLRGMGVSNETVYPELEQLKGRFE